MCLLSANNFPDCKKCVKLCLENIEWYEGLWAFKRFFQSMSAINSRINLSDAIKMKPYLICLCTENCNQFLKELYGKTTILFSWKKVYFPKKLIFGNPYVSIQTWQECVCNRTLGAQSRLLKGQWFTGMDSQQATGPPRYAIADKRRKKVDYRWETIFTYKL